MKKMKLAQTLILAGILLIGFSGLGYLELSLQNSSNNRERTESSQRALELASSLKSYELYPEALEQYDRYLALADIPASQRASILYTTGNIRLDKLSSPRKALPDFLAAAKLVDKSDPLKTDIDLKVVECLESLNRSLDASNRLKEATSLGKSGKSEDNKNAQVIAKVGNEEITLNDVEAEIQKMPPEVQSSLNSPQARTEFVKSLLAKKLLIHAAKRKGLDDDPLVLETISRARDEAMIAKYMKDELGTFSEPTLDEAKLYYEQHKDDFKEEGKGKKKGEVKSFEKVQGSILAMLKEQKRSMKVSELIERLKNAEGVTFYGDKQ